ncbi:DEAD/DEAH box helicase [Stetteria hydrogenophila]
MSYSSRGEVLHGRIRSLVKERGWSSLTSLQERAASAIMSGYNVLIVAPTGAGKTEAALLPVLSMMVEGNPEPVTLLYITPMKALINDLYSRIKWWADRLGFRVSRKHGDTPSRERSARLRRVPHILITTPESLEVDLDWSTSFRRHLANVRFVIVDEVHELIGSKRGAQLLVLLERLKRLSGRDFQRIGLSATVPRPDEVLRALSGSSQRPVKVLGSGSKAMELSVRYVRDDVGDIWVESAKRILAEIEPQTLVFTNSRYAAEKLKEALEGLKVSDVYVHHSSVSAKLREEAERSLKQGKVRAVVCTKTLEVGIDVGKIRRVIQYRAPGSVASLIQRVGRSGHSLNAKPRGTIIAVGWLDFAEALAEAFMAIEGVVEDRLRGRLVPLDVAAKEIVGMALQGGVTVEEAIDTILSSAPETGLSRVELEELVEYLKKRGLVKVEGGLLKPGPTFYKIWRFQGGDAKFWWTRSFTEFFSTISSRDAFTVWSGDRMVGSIDSAFVYRYLRIGDSIRLAGKTWRVKGIDPYQSRLLVEPSNESAEAPLWRGEGPRRSPAVAECFGRVIENPEVPGVDADPEGILEVRRVRDEYVRRGIPIPGRRRVVYERYLNEHVFTVLLGSGANEALALVLAHIASKQAGWNVYYRANFYGFSVHAPNVDVLELLKNLDVGEFLSELDAAIEKSPYMSQVLRSIQLDFGKTDKPDPEEDALLIAEAKRQVIENYLDVQEVVAFLEDLKAGRVELHFAGAGGLTPLSREILSTPAVKPWVHDLADKIAKLLQDNALTVFEIADLLELSTRTVEARLKEMRKPSYGDLRVVAFIDVDEDEWRWTLLSSLESIAGSEEFQSSFTPPNPDEPLRVSYTVEGLEGAEREVVVTPRILSEEGAALSMFPEEMHKVTVRSAYGTGGRGEPHVTYYNVPRSALPLLVRNAAAYLQRLDYW